MATNNTASLRIVDPSHRKSEKFNLNHMVATTMGFGFCEPIHCRKMIPDEKDVVSLKGLVRFDPMVAPTSSGLMQMKFWHKFVGMSDLFRNFGAFLTDQTYGVASGVKKMPYLPAMRHSILSALCLVGSKMSIYQQVGAVDSDGTTGWQLLEDSTAISNILGKWLALPGYSSRDKLQSPLFYRAASYMSTKWQNAWNYSDPNHYVLNLNWILGSLNGDTYIPISNYGAVSGTFFAPKVNGEYLPNSPRVDIGSADFVFNVVYNTYPNANMSTPSDGTMSLAFAFDMSDFGKRWYKILNGLGIGVDFASNEPIDITRIFAYYKAYFDSFGLCLYQNYESTNCNLLLRSYENGDGNFQGYSLDKGYSASDDITDSTALFIKFVNDVCAAFVTEEVDYISAHRKSDVIGSNQEGFVENIVCVDGVGYPSFDQTANPQNDPSLVIPTTQSIYINKVTHTQVDADMLKVLAKSLNMQSVAGRRVAELLRAGGYGKFVDEMHSSFIGMNVIDIDVSDINATCDGVNSVEGADTIFGSTTGKGVGFDQKWADKKYSYQADEFGYWITLCSCVPEGCYYQGNDQTVYEIDRYSHYQKDFDALGFELQRKAVVMCGQDWHTVNWSGNSPSQAAFGLVPRYLRYKFAQNVVNGDFRRRSRRTQCLPFTTDKFIHAADKDLIRKTSDSAGEIYRMSAGVSLSALPIAGDAWRFLNRYPWLANFERIFAYFKDYTDDWNFVASLFNNSNDWFLLMHTEDNIKLFARVYDDAYAPMLSCADSWSTTDDNDGKGQPMSQA